MKCVILAGGLGTRLSEETALRPKPLVSVGAMPILWHIMKIYSRYGFNEFVICLGYKGYMIKEFFHNYYMHQSDICVDLKENSTKIIKKRHENWKIHLIDTGEKTMTGGRLKLIQEFLDDEPFCFTYGDGVADINLNALVEFHNTQNKLCTVTGVSPPARFGAMEIRNNQVIKFEEKPVRGDGASIINGGFFVAQPEIIDFIHALDEPIEQGPLQRLTEVGQLSCYEHRGFWQCMDTLRDKAYLDQLWDAEEAPWKCW